MDNNGDAQGTGWQRTGSTEATDRKKDDKKNNGMVPNFVYTRIMLIKVKPTLF